MPFDVFISYSHKDKTTADAVCAMLESSKIRCWIAPRDIIHGMDWGEGIIDAITGARIMVLIFSGHANVSPQIKREVERAVNRGLPIIPLRIENVPMSKSLEYFLSTPHWLDALTPPIEKHVERLVTSIKALLNINAEGVADGTIKDTSETPPKTSVRQPESAIEFSLRGEAYLHRKEYDRAIRDYDEAIRLDPKNDVSFANRGSAFRQKAEFDRAMLDYDEAIRINPKSASYFVLRGDIFRKKEEFDRAIRDYDEAIRLDPKNDVAFENRGTAFRLKREFDRAILDFDEAIRLNPKAAYVSFINRALSFVDKGQDERAMSDFDAAIHLNPSSAMAFFYRGISKRKMGDFRGADFDIEEAKKIDPNIGL
jgi:lipoprotein NlpI